MNYSACLKRGDTRTSIVRKDNSESFPLDVANDPYRTPERGTYIAFLSDKGKLLVESWKKRDQTAAVRLISETGLLVRYHGTLAPLIALEIQYCADAVV